MASKAARKARDQGRSRIGGIYDNSDKSYLILISKLLLVGMLWLNISPLQHVRNTLNGAILKRHFHSYFM
jgi:hypothetical protein